MEEEQTNPPTYFSSVDEFVTQFIARIYDRPLPNGRRTWCPQWWKHAEAYYRLQSLWLAWEYMRVNDGPLGAAKWLVSYADPIMNVLFDVDGPFKRCSVEGGHQEQRPHPNGELPCEPVDPQVAQPRE